MITTRWMPRTGILLVVALLSAAPVFAQEPEPEERHEVTIEVRNGERTITVNGEKLSEEEAKAYLEEHGLGRRGIARFRLDDEPHAYFFRGDSDDFTVRVDDFLARERPFGGEALWMPGGDMQGSLRERTEIAKMDAESRRLAREVRAAEGAEREQKERELRAKLEEIFARKQVLREAQIERLEDQLAKLREEHRERTDAQAEIIERRLKRLLGESDVYDW